MSDFVDACWRKDVARTPVWFMRQAGRYLPSYQKIRGDRGVLAIAKDPELASSVTVDPVKQLGVDAAVLFADIMLPLEGMGVNFRIEDEVGPVIEEPIKTLDQVEALGDFDAESDVPYVMETIRKAVQKLDGIPLLGFSGAPFTLAGYLIEGTASRDFRKTKKTMYEQPEIWKALMTKLTFLARSYLSSQIRAGADCVQLFDSWVGCLSPDDYRVYVEPYTSEVFRYLSGTVPRIHFCANSASLVEEFSKTGCDALSVDWRVQIGEVWDRTGNGLAVQGNLDPVAALVGGETMERETERILEAARGRRGHVFNLGHGVLKETPPQNLKRIVQMVHLGSGGKK